MGPSTNNSAAAPAAPAPKPQHHPRRGRASAVAANGATPAGKASATGAHAKPAPAPPAAATSAQPQPQPKLLKKQQQPRKSRGGKGKANPAAAPAKAASAAAAAPAPVAVPPPPPPPPSSCDVCGLKRHLAALQAQLAEARKAARPPAISSLTTTALPPAALESVLLDAVHRAAELKLANDFKPEHLCLFPHDADVPVVQRFLAGIAAATEQRVASIEDVLRLPIDAAVDPYHPDEPATVAGRGRGGRRNRNRGGGGRGGGGVAGHADNLNQVQAGSPLHFVAFHGTRTSDALRGITVGGWDPKFRSGQALGPGEYFGRHPSTASGYDSLGSCVVVALLLRVPELVTNRQATDSVVVVANPTELDTVGQTYCLPIGLYGEKAPRQLAQVVTWRAEAADAVRAARLGRAEDARRAEAEAASAAQAARLEQERAEEPQRAFLAEREEFERLLLARLERAGLHDVELTYAYRSRIADEDGICSLWKAFPETVAQPHENSVAVADASDFLNDLLGEAVAESLQTASAEDDHEMCDSPTTSIGSGGAAAAAAAAGSLVRYAMSMLGRGGGGGAKKGPASAVPPRRGTAASATASCSMSREGSM